MIRLIILLLFTVASARAEDAPEMMITSAEQAVACFQKARGTELKAVLTEREQYTLTHLSQMSILFVVLFHPADFQTRLQDPLTGDDNPQLRLFGTFAAAANSKNPTWHLDYTEFNHGHLSVYLDGVTGKLLFVCVVPEG